VLSPVLLL
jgi:hypothetical protein